MENFLYDEMFKLENTHWWFSAKRTIVLSILKKFLKTDNPDTPPVVCDFGCGCGATLSALLENNYDAVGLDSNHKSMEYCSKRNVTAFEGRLPEDIPEQINDLDAALLLDVLEHIKDDKAALAAVLERVKPGGLIICTVPAYPFLWTKRDRYHHHRRRYTKSQLSDVIKSTGNTETIVLSYFNTILFPFALVERLSKKIFPPRGLTTDIHCPPRIVNNLLKRVLAFERVLINRKLTFPYGLSILTVLRKCK